MEENIEKLCEEIRKESEGQEQEILRQAKTEAEKILSDANNTAVRLEGEEKKKCDEEIEKMKEHISSTTLIEKKKTTLLQHNAFVEEVFGKVKDNAYNFRNSGQYGEFLKKSIKEGLEVINASKMDVLYSQADEKVFTPPFIKDAEEYCNSGRSEKYIISFQKGKFNDIGVIVKSSDGKTVYDNRFFTRFDRIKEDIRMRITREVFKNV